MYDDIDRYDDVWEKFNDHAMWQRCDGKSSPFQDDKILFSLYAIKGIHVFCFVTVNLS